MVLIEKMIESYLFALPLFDMVLRKGIDGWATSIV